MQKDIHLELQPSLSHPYLLTMIDPLRYPVGLYEVPEVVSDQTLEKWVEEISSFPRQVEELTSNLAEEELQKTYRAGGWDVKQVVHHCADSHMNALIRFKLALTEEGPTIRPYFEGRWAELEDGKTNELDHSLALLKGLHGRWATLLRSLSTEQLERTLIHPDFDHPWTVRAYVGNYAWHCRHHLAHIRQALKINESE